MKRLTNVKSLQGALVALRETGAGQEFLAAFHNVVLPFARLDTTYQAEAEILLGALVNGDLNGTLREETRKQPAPAPSPVHVSTGKRKHPTVVALEAAGYGIERTGSKWNVWHNEKHPGVTAEFDRLSDIDPTNPL